ncbi:MAG: phosphoglycerate dehydrogenase [Deltaproteobacteria bacterium]|nr:phosphoglycerate dehydrogenase [Deltaproteobacteria bacterium]
MKILISTSSFAEVSRRPLEQLERAGHAVALNPHKRQLNGDEAKALYADIDGVIAGTEKITSALLECAPRLKCISRVGTGVDAVDLQAAAARGIPVFNTPTAHVDAVAELVLAGTLSVLRKLGESDRAIRRGEWKKPMGGLLRGKTVGIVGLGRIGRALVKLLMPFDVRLLASDPQLDASFADAHGVRPMTIDELVTQSDVLTFNLSFSSEAKNLLSAQRIAKLKPTAVVVNCARGGLIDEHALGAFLRTNPDAGAYLDTFDAEPYRGPLTELDNVLLSAHIGSYAREARERMESEAVEHLLQGLAGRKGNVA